VESVLRQTFDDIELIVVDDCSTDGTLAYLESICDPRFRYLRHDRNKGGNAARNTGIAAARADIVAFQDSDDEWLVTKLEKQLRAFDALPMEEYGVVYCGKIVYGRDDRGNRGARLAAYVPSRDRPVVDGELANQLLRHPLISTQTLVARKSLLQRVGGFDEELSIGQDWDLTLRLARHTKVAFVEEPLVLTFVMRDSISLIRSNASKTWQKMLEKHYDLVSRDKYLHARNLTEIARIYQRAGQWAEARPYVRAALGVNWLYFAAWKALVASCILPLLRSR
jgi:glycosyltransferase involved in cell wall biosynthesis